MIVEAISGESQSLLLDFALSDIGRGPFCEGPSQAICFAFWRDTITHPFFCAVLSASTTTSSACVASTLTSLVFPKSAKVEDRVNPCETDTRLHMESSPREPISRSSFVLDGLADLISTEILRNTYLNIHESVRGQGEGRKLTPCMSSRLV